MIIKEMPEYDVRNMIQQTHVGRLSYILDNRPVIVPMGFRFSGGSLYSFTTEGQKTEAMRRNNAVCILFDAIVSRTEWRSVVVHGRFRELADAEEKAAIAKLMSSDATWWEPAYTKTLSREGKERALEPVFFRVDIESATGHQTS